MFYIPTTKGAMEAMLKRHGVRRGEKAGLEVSLEHLKTADLCNLYAETFKDGMSDLNPDLYNDKVKFRHWVRTHCPKEVENEN